MNFVYYICGIVLIVAGFVWLGVAWIWYRSFPVPYLWLVWAVTSPIWFATSWFFLSIPIGYKMKMARLRARGVRIKTKFFNVEINFLFSVNSQHPYYIESVGTNPKTSERTIFRSGDIWFNPQPFVSKDQEIEVVIDPERPQDYFMDVSFLADKVKEAATPKL